jgi:hypothetical protein
MRRKTNLVEVAGMMSLACVSVFSAVFADTPKDDVPKEAPPTRAQIKKSENNLKIIGLAMHNHELTFGHLPFLVGKDGKPLLSWRVALLPWLEEEKLYKQFKLDEPWDSDHNKKLLAKMPKVYQAVRKKPADDETYYRVFVGNRAMFDMKQKTRFADVADGLSNTIMAIEAGEAVQWTKPDELEYDPKKKLPDLGGMFDGDFHALFGDGMVRLFHKGKKAESLHRLIVRDSGIPRQEEDFKP